MAQEGVPRQLRLAPVMTGGTSLAVWMGGVTSELYSVLRSVPVPVGTAGPSPRESTYTRILEATNTTPVVDVVTGTSAGGLNGMLLAVAVHLGLPVEQFDLVRETWMNDGDIASLLRSPSESDPPSLLRGDAYFQDRIEKVLETWWTHRTTTRGSDGDCQVDLLTTYTRVRPTPVVRQDDFDEPLNEVSYAGTLRFDHDHLDGEDQQVDHGDLHDDDQQPEESQADKERRVRRKLAIASRTSAGIPGVFEPSFLPSNSEDATRSDRPDFSAHQPPQVRGLSRWAVDGGVVVNLPLRYVIDRIFGQRARGRVRRVVLYISPTPADALPREPDTFSARPKIAESTITIVNAPRAEGIAADVDAIRRSNDGVERQRQARRSIGRLLDGADPQLLGELYSSYGETRSSVSVRRVASMLSTRFEGDERFDEADFLAVLGPIRRTLLPGDIDEFGGGGRPWGWGIATIEQAASTVLGLLNQALEILAGRRDPAGTVDAAVALCEYKVRVHEQLTEVGRLRGRDDRFWTGLVESIRFPGDADDARKREIRRERYAAAYDDWPIVGGTGEDAEAGRLEVFEQLRSAHREIVRVLLEAAPSMQGLAVAAIGDRVRSVADDVDGSPTVPAPPGPADVTGFLAELRSCAGDAPSVDVTAAERQDATSSVTDAALEAAERRMLRFHVIATQTIGGFHSREQPVQLMQISSNAPNLLDPERESVEKLVGPELGRLGAFFKESWRANDWFWGRMDGAARLCRVLVDPRRLWELYGDGEEERRRALVDLGLLVPGEADDDLVPTVDVATLAQIDHELDALLGSVDPHGLGLPTLVETLIRQRQLAIAREEIPQLCEAIERSEQAGGNERSSRPFHAAARALGSTPTDDEVVAVVQKLRIGDETAASELGSRLMVRNLTRAATVGTNAATGSESGLSAVRKPLRAIRAPLRLLSAMIATLTGGSPLARGLTAMILAAAGAIVALRLAGVEVSGLLAGAATVLFVGALVVALVRMGVWRFAVMFAVLAVPFTLALVGGDLREVAFDEIRVTRVEVGDAVTITFGSEVRVEVSDPGSPLVGCEPGTPLFGLPGPCGFVQGGSEEIVVDPATITALLVQATGVSTGLEPVSHWWKSIFTANWGVAPFAWAMFALALWCVVRGVRALRSRAATSMPTATASIWLPIAWFLGATAAVAVGIANQLLAERWLTGPEATRGRKAAVVGWAESLADQRLLVLLLLLVVVGTIIGLGTSGLSRAWRRRSRKL